MIEMIALVVDNNVCEIDKQIPVVLEAHLDRYRELIEDMPIVMGSKTFESIGEMPGLLAAETVVLCRNERRFPSGVVPMHSLIQILDKYENFIVVGGTTVFADFIPVADKIHITEVSEVAVGEKAKYFPNLKSFKLVNPMTEMQTEGDHYFRLLEYVRK